MCHGQNVVIDDSMLILINWRYGSSRSLMLHTVALMQGFLSLLAASNTLVK